MPESTPETIQASAEFWAKRLGHRIDKDRHPAPTIYAYQVPFGIEAKTFLAGHRTCARAFVEALCVWQKTPNRMGRIWDIWATALHDPTAALIELARVVREVEA